MSFKLPTDRDYLQLPRVRMPLDTPPHTTKLHERNQVQPRSPPPDPRKKQCGSRVLVQTQTLTPRPHTQSNQDPCGSAYTTRTRIAGANSTTQQEKRQTKKKKGDDLHGRRSCALVSHADGHLHRTTALIGLGLLVAGLLSSFLRISGPALTLAGWHALAPFVPLFRASRLALLANECLVD